MIYGIWCLGATNLERNQFLILGMFMWFWISQGVPTASRCRVLEGIWVEALGCILFIKCENHKRNTGRLPAEGLEFEL